MPELSVFQSVWNKGKNFAMNVSLEEQNQILPGLKTHF